MSDNNDQPEKGPVDYAILSSQALTVGAEVGCLTLLIVLVSVFAGIWLDKLLGTKPVITIILVVASAPLSLVLTFWVAKRSVSKIPTSPAQVRDVKDKEGDTIGE
jgi:F0F1-type ATP synthase assembly protein I